MRESDCDCEFERRFAVEKEEVGSGVRGMRIESGRLKVCIVMWRMAGSRKG